MLHRLSRQSGDRIEVAAFGRIRGLLRQGAWVNASGMPRAFERGVQPFGDAQAKRACFVRSGHSVVEHTNLCLKAIAPRDTRRHQQMNMLVARIAVRIGCVDSDEYGHAVRIDKVLPELLSESDVFLVGQLRRERDNEFPSGSRIAPNFAALRTRPHLFDIERPRRFRRREHSRRQHTPAPREVVRGCATLIDEARAGSIRRRRNGAVALASANGRHAGVKDGHGRTR
jgi:hypothetical protein